MNNKLSKFFIATFSLLLVGSFVFGQDSQSGDSFFYSRLFTNLLIIIAAIIILAGVGILYRLFKDMIKVQQMQIYQERGLEASLDELKKSQRPWWKRFQSKLDDSASIESEEDILFDHEFDGIRELDNNLPPWWLALFYICIAFAVVYMTYYHFIGIGPGSQEEYELEMERAEEAIAEYIAQQAAPVDETNVAMLEGESDLSFGKTIWEASCIVCHGALGEGGIGPNMTDEYWVHGGSIQDIFKTIKYGVPEKGMISWQSQLSPDDMQRVSSYILTLQGTNPPNAKEPEGEKFVQEGTTEEDSASEESGDTEM